MSAPALAVALALGLAGCTGDSSDGAQESAAVESAMEAMESAVASATDAPGDEDATQDLEEMAAEMAESLESLQASQGGGSATLTAGDQSWTFDSVLCAFGADEIGQEGAEFVLSSIQDGLQFYVSIDDFGHSMSLDDIKNFEDPSVTLFSDGSEDFITVDGKSASGETSMVVDDGSGRVEASFEATCP